MKGLLIVACGLACSGALAGVAAAQTYSGSISNPNMGTIASGTSSTTFTFTSNTGAVSSSPVGNGGGTIAGKTGTTRFAVQYTCSPGSGASHACPTSIKLVLTAPTVSGSTSGGFGSLGNFTATASSGTITSSGTFGNGNFFMVTPDPSSHDAAIWIGASLSLAANSSGTATSKANVQFQKTTGTTLTTSQTGTLTATAYVPIGVVQTKELNFGTYVLPTGSATVMFSPGASTPVVSGTVRLSQALDATPALGEFKVTGRDQEPFNLAVDPSFDMTLIGGSASDKFTVYTANNAAANPKLGSQGSAGQYVFKVGGFFSISNATKVGAYSGTYHVTVTYQ